MITTIPNERKKRLLIVISFRSLHKNLCIFESIILVHFNCDVNNILNTIHYI
jgi:hypothetical protein